MTRIVLLQINKFRNYISDILLIFIASLLPLTWFKDGFYITYFDFDFPFYPFYGQERYFYLWDRLSALGTPFTKPLAQIPYQMLIKYITSFGFPLIYLQKIYFIFLFFLAGTSMYLLTISLLENKNGKRLAALVAAFFYMFNPIVMNVYIHNFLLLPFHVYALLPAILAIFIKGLNENKLIYSISIGLLFVLVSPSFSNAAWGSVIFIVLFFYCLFYTAKNIYNFNRLLFSVKFFSIVVLLFFLMNAYWILPQIYFLGDEYFKSTFIRNIIGETNLDVLKLTSERSSILNVIRLEGLHNFYSDGNPYFAYSYSSIYKQKFKIFISFLIPLLVFSALIWKNKNRNIIFFSIISLFAVLLMKGIHPPLNNLILWIYNNIPLFDIYRNIYFKFAVILTLSYAFLLGVGISELNYKFKRYVGSRISYVGVLFLVGLIVVVYPLPMWKGEVIPKTGETYPGGYVRVPGYYSAANQWLESQNDYFRIFPLPFNRLFYSTYNWEYGYFGTDPSLWLFKKPTISRITDTSYNIPLSVAETINSNPLPSLKKALGYLNVKYVLLHDDTHWNSLKTNMPRKWWVLPEKSADISSEFFKKNLDAMNLSLKETFGRLRFYENDFFVEYIYTPNTIVVTNSNNFPELIKILSFKEFTNKSAILYPINHDNELYANTILLYGNSFDGILIPTSGLYDIYIRLSSMELSKPSEWTYIEQRYFKNGEVVTTSWFNSFGNKSEVEILLEYSRSNIRKNPEIEYSIESPVKIIVHIRNATTPYFLIFGEQYHPGWKATIDGTEINEHLKANGFANAWHINKSGNYNIVIYFKPQRILYLGGTVSLITFFTSIIVLAMYVKGVKKERFR